MSESGILSIGNPLHAVSVQAVIVPSLQVDVDHIVSLWNLHHVRKIRENGRDLPSHVPAAQFRLAEHIARWAPFQCTSCYLYSFLGNAIDRDREEWGWQGNSASRGWGRAGDETLPCARLRRRAEKGVRRRAHTRGCHSGYGPGNYDRLRRQSSQYSSFACVVSSYLNPKHVSEFLNLRS